MPESWAGYPGKFVLFGVLILSVTACQGRMAPTMTPEEIAEAVKGKSTIFVEKNGGLTFEGVEELYLGQPEEEAMAVLNELCPVIEVYDGGWRHRGAVFKGCILESHESVKTVRAGFWPHNENRVSTLELKEGTFEPRHVRARFTQVAGQLREDLPRTGVLVMTSDRYRLFANWDEGSSGRTHLTIGFQP